MDIDLIYGMSIARGRGGFIFTNSRDSIDAKRDSELLMFSRTRSFGHNFSHSFY